MTLNSKFADLLPELRSRAEAVPARGDVKDAIFQTLATAKISPRDVTLDEYKVLVWEAVRAWELKMARGSAA